MASAEPKKGGQEQAGERAPSRSNPSEVWRQFEDAYRLYVRALEDTQAEGQKQYAQAWRGYGQAQQALQTDMQRLYQEAYRNYIGAVRDAWGQEDALQRAERADRESMKSLEEEQSKMQKSGEQAYEQCAEAVQQAARELQHRMYGAYQNYLKSLQRAWSQADVNTIDPAMLASISQSTMAAALLSGSTIANSQVQS